MYVCMFVRESVCPYIYVYTFVFSKLFLGAHLLWVQVLSVPNEPEREREKEREREREDRCVYVCVCVCVHKRKTESESACVCICECARK